MPLNVLSFVGQEKNLEFLNKLRILQKTRMDERMTRQRNKRMNRLTWSLLELLSTAKNRHQYIVIICLWGTSSRSSHSISWFRLVGRHILFVYLSVCHPTWPKNQWLLVVSVQDILISNCHLLLYINIHELSY